MSGAKEIRESYWRRNGASLHPLSRRASRRRKKTDILSQQFYY